MTRLNLFTTLAVLLPLSLIGCVHGSPKGMVMETTKTAKTLGNNTEGITVTRGESMSPQNAPADYFTGSVRVTQLFPPHDPARTSGGSVTFPLGARSAWHTHPFGQVLIVTAGEGRVQNWGGPVQVFHAGDVVWIPPGVKHWHGASPSSSMTHIAIQENLDGKAVEWMEKVSDEQYGDSPATQPAESNDMQQVVPALDAYTKDHLLEEVWKRRGLTARDRSIVTIAALIAKNQTASLPFYLDLALDNGVKPSELSEIIMHLAFYSGWGNAEGAVVAAKGVFAKRGIGPEQLPPADVTLLPIDEASEAKRVTTVENNIGKVAPGVVQYTTDALFRYLWLRPGLSPRDRSLVTVSALIASGQVAQITFHLNRAMDNGLTEAQASEVFTQLAFYAGWPNVMSALPVAKEVFEKRTQK